MNQQSRILSRANPDQPFTVWDYHHLMQSGVLSDSRIELIDGELVKMAPASMSHGERNGSVWALLRSAYVGEPVRIGVDVAFRIDDLTVRAADVVVASPSVADAGIAEARDILLAIEIAERSPARDLGPKRDDYARAGIAHYWVVDTGARIVRVMSDPVDGRYTTEGAIRFGEPLPVPCTDRTITID